MLKRPQSTEHDKLVKQAEVWVAQTFYGTLLKQMHDSPFKSELFSGGRGGEAFGPMYDQHLIERMSHTGGARKLVRSMVRKLEKSFRPNTTDEPTDSTHEARSTPRVPANLRA